jgi:hypothetical protein
MDYASGSVFAGYDNLGQVFPSEPADKKVFERDIDNGEKSLSQSSVTTGEQFLSQHPLFLLISRTGELSSSLLSPRTEEISSSQQLSSYRDYVAFWLSSHRDLSPPLPCAVFGSRVSGGV